MEHTHPRTSETPPDSSAPRSPVEHVPMPVRTLYRQVRDTAKITLRNLRCWNLTEDGVADLYRGDYHDARGYTTSPEHERHIKDAQAEFIVRNTGAKKVLVAGCSAGELLVSLERAGVEAWGFDIAADLQSFCLESVRQRVRVGRMTRIPFDRADGFDAIVAIDVFEHVPRRSVPTMVDELTRLGAPALVTLINHVSLNDPGHVTLMPLLWWRVQLRRAYHLRPEERTLRLPRAGIYGLDPSDRVHVLRAWDLDPAT